MLGQTVCNAEFQGGDGQSVFSIPFPFLDTAHIAAFVRTNDGREKTLFAGADYTLTRQPDSYGEFILLGDALAAGETLVIERAVPLTQEIFFHNQGPNSPKASEEALDKLTMIAQQHAEAIARRIVAPHGENPEQFVEKLQADSARIGALESSVQSLAHSVGGKADKTHTHDTAAITGLAECFATKADAAALSGFAAKNHAAQHALGGGDSLSPAALGAMPSAPSDGKPYLASGNGWLEHIPQCGSGGEAGTTDHAALQNRDAPDQHPQSAIQCLDADLREIRQALDATCDAASALALAVESKPGMEAIEQLTARLNDLEQSALSDAPADGAQYARCDNAWAEISAAPGGQSAGAYVGEIRLFPFRADELPGGWYFCNGDRYALSSPQGAALAALPASYRQDWNIAAAGDSINLPALFAGDAGYFFRPANNSTRMPGSVQTDAIRNITGSVLSNNIPSLGLIAAGGNASGAFVKGAATDAIPQTSTKGGSQLAFDASAAVPTADENRPCNIAMTPALYLGV